MAGTPDDPLTPAGISAIAWDVREQTADPSDARRLLRAFCDCVRESKPIQRELAEHLAGVFGAYLDGKKSIEAALGLTRRKGRPNADQQVQMQMAAEVLRRRLGEMPHQEALDEVARIFGCGKTIVGDAWSRWQSEGLVLLRMERSLGNYPWTPEEVQRMAEIFVGKSWFVAPGKSLI